MAGNEADVVRDETRRGLDGSNREAGLRRRETTMTDTQSKTRRQMESMLDLDDFSVRGQSQAHEMRKHCGSGQIFQRLSVNCRNW